MTNKLIEAMARPFRWRPRQERIYREAYYTSRPMTPAEREAFDRAFDAMDAAFLEMNKAFQQANRREEI